MVEGVKLIMKWKKKGHEFDEIAHDYLDAFGDKKIFIFGTGITAKEYACTFKSFDILKGFVDNDIDKHGDTCLGKEIISFEKWERKYKDDTFLLVCVNEKNYVEIRGQLLNYGLIEKRNFIYYLDFINKVFPVLMNYYDGCIFLPLVQISLTERCTLKCKKCAHACNLVPKSAPDLSVAEACRSADALFSVVDYVQEFVLIGGEPLLYKDLAKVIEYIGAKYRDKINFFSITTNGTLIPNDEVLYLCEKYNVIFRISNYSKTLPWICSKHEKLISKLKEGHVNYILAAKDTYWMDYGFEYFDRKANPEQLEVVFDKCFTPCHEVRGNKFYFCVMARTVSENSGLNVGVGDYLDLGEINTKRDKRIFLEYIMGYSDKGYLDMCNYCHGADTIKFPIPAAEQMV